MMKYEGVCFCEIERVKANIIHSIEFTSPIAAAFELNILSKYLCKHDPKQAPQYLNVLWSKLNKLL